MIKISKSLQSVSGALFVASSVAAVVAEEGVSLQETTVTGQAPVGYQVESTSGALFANTSVMETPFSLGLYTKELIEDQRAFSLREVLENDPSIALQMPGGFYGTQNFASRGFRVDNFNGYRIDGLPRIQTVAPSIDNLERVEVLKGPSALRYGFMAPGGSINLVRKRPTHDFYTSVQLDADTFGRTYGQLDVSDTVANGAFGYRLVLAAEDFDSFYDHAEGERYFGSLFTEWKPFETTTLWSSIGVQDFTRNGYYGPMISKNGKVLDTGVKTNIMQDWAHNDQETFDFAIGADVDLSESWKLRSSFSYQDTSRYSALSYPYGVEDNGDFTDGAMLTDGPFEWESWGAHAHVEGSFDTGILKHDLVVGGQYRTYDSIGKRGFPDIGPNNAFNLVGLPKPVLGGAREISFEYEEYGFFLTDTIEFTEQWSALLGARYGQYENTYPDDPASNDTVSAWSPTFALMFEPVQNVNSYVTYTRGVQDGGFADRTANNAWEPLGVQESEQWEVGVKAASADGRYSGEISLFQIQQDLAVIGSDGVDAFNGEQLHKGIEMAFRAQVTDHFQAGIATMLLDAEQVDTGDAALDGKRPQHVPGYQVNVWGALDIEQVPGLTLTAGARFVDKQFLDQAEEFATDSYAVLDLGARYKFQAGDADYTLRLNVSNVLDERYYETGEYYSGDAGYLSYGAPVSAGLSLQIEF